MDIFEAARGNKLLLTVWIERGGYDFDETMRGEQLRPATRGRIDVIDASTYHTLAICPPHAMSRFTSPPPRVMWQRLRT